MKNNKIKIAGVIKDKPQLILDASEYERRRYETKLVAERKSGTEDVLILQFDGSAMQEEDFEKLEAGTCVNVTGEIRTENVREIVPTAPTVKIFIAAGKVQIVEAITEKQNVVKLCGHICKDPRARGTSKGIHITDIMIAVKGKKNGRQRTICKACGVFREVFGKDHEDSGRIRGQEIQQQPKSCNSRTRENNDQKQECI